MKAITYHRYGGPEVMNVEEIATPKPKENEVLIKIKAASLTRADTLMRMGSPKFGRLMLGLFKPKTSITGTGYAGEVVAIGEQVSRFKIGDRVFGETVFGRGSHAEYTTVSENSLISTILPGLSYDEMAVICDGPLTSINFLKNCGNIHAGQKILINAGSGSLGSAAIQLAKAYGAIVTAVCSTQNTSLVRSLGADYVIDYKKQDLTKLDQTYDVIYDTIGILKFSNIKKNLTSHGIYMSPVLNGKILWQMMTTSIFGRKKVKFSATGMLKTKELRVLLDELKQHLSNGQLKIVLDRSYKLEEIIEAHRYIDSGRKRGNVTLQLV
ncbi:NAD(P)-dependent alcohol dehydrogenase [Membranihabitans marinus]|uniref:NAD(P)-dependent alcohol dehydrogenase n=1 Tax=Membranihabitans marinus TaxID=1227546 RepID=UPI001F3AA7F0|nr:NAD(P)-dependent alcohol dehydrogenase [Membranihabitans marinus]